MLGFLYIETVSILYCPKCSWHMITSLRIMELMMIFLRHVSKALFNISSPKCNTYVQQIFDKYITDMDSITTSKLMT